MHQARRHNHTLERARNNQTPSAPLPGVQRMYNLIAENNSVTPTCTVVWFFGPVHCAAAVRRLQQQQRRRRRQQHPHRQQQQQQQLLLWLVVVWPLIVVGTCTYRVYMTNHQSIFYNIFHKSKLRGTMTIDEAPGVAITFKTHCERLHKQIFTKRTYYYRF